VVEAEMREARREYEPVVERPAFPHPLVASNGHGPDLAPEHEDAVSANGKGDAAGNGVPFGAPLPVTDSSLELQDRDQ